ncbi:RICIN domain-containing protein [Kitasatospora sp. NPDC008115]|uniref:RICIN domain-containing protein n=1 Tax=Kitasatospora sp. NPDC008115 TaxID=3364022 RepID=UPI0036ED555E
MLKRIKALTIAAASVAALGLGMGAAQEAGAVPSNVCQSSNVHTYNDNYAGAGHPAEYLEVNGWGGQGAAVGTWDWVNQDNERWCLEKAAEGGWYFHPKYNPNLCLDVPGNKFPNKMVVWTCNGRINQRFDMNNHGPNGQPTGGHLWSVSDSRWLLDSTHHNGGQVGMAYFSDGAATRWQ